MSIRTTLARPYAKAAFAEAVQTDTVQAWSQLLQTAALVLRDPDMLALIDNPRVTVDECLSILLDICGVLVHEPGKNFLTLLANNYRLDILPEIAELFASYQVEQEKTVRVLVTSTAALTDAEQQALSRALKKRLQREVILECRLDSALLGGLIIQAGDLVIDGSIRGKLARLNTQLMN